MTILNRIRERLQQAGVESYTLLFHRPVFTSEEAAAVRGTPLASGAKALVLKADDRFILAVLPADRKLDNRRLREQLGVKSLRFASREELLQLTGVPPGAVPPFGSLFGLPPTATQPCFSKRRSTLTLATMRYPCTWLPRTT